MDETKKKHEEENMNEPAPVEVEVKKGKKKKESEAEAHQKEMAELTDRLLRTTAEYDNYRKRTEKEKQGSMAYGTALAVERLLPALDTLDIALAAESADAEYKKGVVLTADLFQKALQSLGVTEIEALGKPFDPQYHAAVSRETREGVESGTITAVLQKGYSMGDRILRHSMVMVAE